MPTKTDDTQRMSMAELKSLLLSPTALWGFAILLALLLLPLLKALAWRLFRFDTRLQSILSQTKSSEVRTGKLVETLAPILDDFPVDIRKPGTSTVFLGQPVDFVHFDPEAGITFIEVKSNDATLTNMQRCIRTCVEEGRVSWREYRLRGDGGATISTRARDSRRKAG